MCSRPARNEGLAIDPSSADFTHVLAGVPRVFPRGSGDTSPPARVLPRLGMFLVSLALSRGHAEISRRFLRS
jgi:hypothetical protein